MKEVELKDKRKLREKHFLREDGTVVARIYNQNVHYKKNGSFEEINNHLIKEKNSYRNKSNNYQAFYKYQGKDTLLELKKDEHYVNISLKNANETRLNKLKSEQLMNEVEYNNILDGIDIKYQTLPTKVKETIILHKNNFQKLAFIVDTNLSLEIYNGMILAKKEQQIIFTIEKPHMEDSKGKLNYNIFYKLRKEKSKYELDLILDKEWLNSKDVVYPVYVDPTITDMNREIGLSDTYIFPGDNGIDKNSLPILKAGVERVNGTDIVNRTLIKFDLPEIGTGSEIIGAYLTLIGYPTDALSTDNRTVTMHRVTQDWDEATATWDVMHDKYDSRIESVYYGGRTSTYLIDGEIILEHGMYDGNITNIVKKWYRDTPNYGLLLKDAKEEYCGEYYPAFCSKSFGSYHNIDSNLRPIFELVYRNFNGLENYLDYLTQNFTDGTTYINTYTGNMTGIFDIGHTIGGKLPISLKLVYNTNDVILKNRTSFGNGYKVSFDQNIQTRIIGDYEYLEYHDEDGTIHYFYKDKTENTYLDEDGLNLTITKDENYCTMNDRNGNSLLFEKRGEIYRLTEIQDVQGNKIEIELDINNNITKIIDTINQEIVLNYLENEIQIINQDSTTKLKLENGVLKQIETPNGTTNLSYNENGFIEKITDVTGLSIRYEYHQERPYRMKKVTQYGSNNKLGNSFELTYGFDTTKIKDHQGMVQTLVFNQQGNLLEINHLNSNEDLNNAYTITKNYGSESNHKNKLLTDSIPIKSIRNYISNSSFEEGEDGFQTMGEITKSLSTEYAHLGYKSVQLVSTGNDGSAYRDFSVPKGKYYTFSGYFKSDVDAMIILEYNDEYGYPVEEKERLEKSNEFRRIDVTLNYYQKATTALRVYIQLYKAGTLYMDDIQLEEGEVANTYNILDHSDFSEGLDGWMFNAWSFDDPLEIVPTSEVFEVVQINNQQNTALKVTMNPLHGSSFQKRFPIKGKKGDLYNISFWFKNEGIPGQGDGGIIGNDVSIYFKPVGHDAEYCVLPSEEFHTDDNIWQYFTFRYGAEEDYEAIYLCFSQGRECNSFYITNLTFYKDLANNQYEYDEQGNITRIKDSTKTADNVFQYDMNNQLISATTPRGRDLKVEYDNIKTDRVLSAVSATGILNQVKYDSFGNPVRTRICKKGVEELTSGLYRIRSKGTRKYIKSRGHEIIIEEDACSNTIWRLESVGNTYKIVFDLLPAYHLVNINNNILLSPYSENNLFYLEENQNKSYHIKSSIDNQYLKTEGNQLKITSLIQNDPSFEFYLETLDEEFIEHSSTYTEDGRFITSITDPNFNQISYETDSMTGLITKETNAKGNDTTYTYNTKKQLTSISQGEKTVNYTYNNQNVLSKIQEGEREYIFEYDEFLNPKTVKIGENITLVTNEYEENNGNLSSVTYGNGEKIEYEYDDFNRKKKVRIYDNNKDYHYRYDSNGNLCKVLVTFINTPFDTPYDVTPKPDLGPRYSCIEKLHYDTGNRLTEYEDLHLKIHYEYDENDNIIKKNYQKYNTINRIENIYNKDDMIVESKIDHEVIKYQYDGLGRIIKKTINDHYPITYEYVSNGKRTSTLIKSITNRDDRYSYEYDEFNNITHVYHNGELQNRYRYDLYNELVEEDDYSISRTIKYTYDNYGNLLTRTTTDLQTGEIIKSDTYEYGNEAWKDQLTKYNNQSISYDAIGNPEYVGSGVQLFWSNGRSLSRCKSYGSLPDVFFEYNKDGIRIQKESAEYGTIDYYLENDNIIYETRNKFSVEGADYFEIRYLYDLTGIIGLEYNENVYYYEKNLQGDIIGILDSAFHKIVTYKYDSWGKILSVQDSEGNEITDETHIGLINPFRYRSYYYDQELDLYYLKSRYYNPTWGRFLNADGIIGANEDILGYNLYAYCSNNPINNSDSSGKGLFSRVGQFFVKAKNTINSIAETTKNMLGHVINSLISINYNYTLPIADSKVSFPGGKIEKSQANTYSKKILGGENSLIKLNINDSSDKSSTTVGIEANLPILNAKFDIGARSLGVSGGIIANGNTYHLDTGINGFQFYGGIGIDSPLIAENSMSNYLNFSINAALPIAIYAISNGIFPLQTPGLPSLSY